MAPALADLHHMHHSCFITSGSLLVTSGQAGGEHIKLVS